MQNNFFDIKMWPLRAQIIASENGEQLQKIEERNSDMFLVSRQVSIDRMTAEFSAKNHLPFHQEIFKYGFAELKKRKKKGRLRPLFSPETKSPRVFVYGKLTAT